MRIEVKEVGKKEYYDEFLYIFSKYKKFKKNPRRKAYQFTKYLLVYNIICFLTMLIFVLFYIYYNDPFFLFLTGMLTVTLMIAIIYQVIYTKRINMFLNNKGVKTVDINEDGIEYIDDDKNIRVKWEDVKYVIISKYSICILPKTIMQGFTSISVKYKKELIECLNKYKKENLLVDNSSFYKWLDGKMKYIVVKTFCDNEEIADKIIDNLLEKRLISGAQKEEISSSYFWNNEIVKNKEFKLEFRTRANLFEEIKKEIEILHNYKVPEITAFEIIDGNKDFFNWIYENTKNI